MGTFRVEVTGLAEWPDPPFDFADRNSAIRYAKGLAGRLLDMGASDDARVNVRANGIIQAAYTVSSWRTAIIFLGDKAYVPSTTEDNP